jgi:hypothetical protein
VTDLLTYRDHHSRNACPSTEDLEQFVWSMPRTLDLPNAVHWNWLLTGLEHVVRWMIVAYTNFQVTDRMRERLGKLGTPPHESLNGLSN